MKLETPVLRKGVVAALLLLGAVWVPAWAASPPELCDGRDNDADGSLDEGCLRTCADRRLLPAGVAEEHGNTLTRIGHDRAVVWDGSRLALVWMERDEDGTPQDPVIRLRRYDSAAAPLEPPIDVAQVPDAFGLTGPVVAWSGSGYGIAWDGGMGDDQIHFAFVDADGNLTSGPVALATSGFQEDDPAIVWDGAAFVVAWVRDLDRVYMSRVAPDGTVLVPETCISCAAAAGAADVSLALRGSEIGYAWAVGGATGGVRFTRSALDGTPIGAIVDLDPSDEASDPSLVATEEGWAASWSAVFTIDPTEIRFRRLDGAGMPLGPAVRVDDAVTEYVKDPSLVWTGEEYLLGWVAYWAVLDSGWQLAVREIDAGGAPLGSVSLHQEDRLHDFPRLSTVWTGSYLGAAWRFELGEFNPESFLRIGGFRCCRDGDADGSSWCDGDGDDGDATVHPGATEVCDGRDNDLDGTLDEGCERSCEAAAVAAMEDFGAQQSPGVALAAGGGEVFLVHADPAAAGVQLVVERGDAPWSAEPVEENEAVSDQPAAAWTGERIAALFRDEREAEPRLRVTLRDELGAAPVFDEPVAPAAAGTEKPVMAWDGLGLALGWRESADANLAFTRLLDSGNRLLDGLLLAPGSGGDPPELALAPDGGGGTALALLEPSAGGLAVSFERRDRFGAARHPGGDLLAEPRTQIAAPATGRRDPAVVATPEGYLVAWSGPEGSGGEREIILAHLDGEGQVVSGPAALTDAGGGPDQPVLVWSGEEAVLLFRDFRDGDRGRPFRVRLSATGSRLGPDVPVGDDRDVNSLAATWDGQRVRLAWSRREGSGWAVRAGALDCAAAMAPSLVRHLRFAGKSTLAWDACEAAVYDVVSGDLAALAAGEGFTAATDTCEANDLAGTELTVGDRALPAFYLVRAVVSATAGSYAPDDGRQTPDRDAGIAAAAASCP